MVDLGTTWELFWSSFELFWSSCARPGAALVHSWTLLGSSLGALARSWGALGILLGGFRGVLGRSWTALGDLSSILDAPEVDFGSSEGPFWGGMPPERDRHFKIKS